MELEELLEEEEEERALEERELLTRLVAEAIAEALREEEDPELEAPPPAEPTEEDPPPLVLEPLDAPADPPDMDAAEEEPPLEEEPPPPPEEPREPPPEKLLEGPPRPKSLRLPRIGGVLRVMKFCAAVVPVSRIVFCRVPCVTGAVRTVAIAAWPAFCWLADCRYHIRPATEASTRRAAIHRPLPFDGGAAGTFTSRGAAGSA
ncbi:MAG: hypothetical protein JJE04_10255 [Acidobacteriia bacterium]|nr:hypothetical protein [Terriglobia bacterium]